MNGSTRHAVAAVEKLKSLDQRQVSMAMVILFMAGALAVYSMGSPLKQRLSHLPVKGQVAAFAPQTDLPRNPTAIPAAVAVPPANVKVQEADLEDVDQIFLPAPKAEPELEKEDLRAKAEQVIRLALGSVTLDGIVNKGAFLSGRFVQIGQGLGFNVSGPDGKDLPVILARIGPKQATLRAGEFTHILKLPQD